MQDARARAEENENAQTPSSIVTAGLDPIEGQVAFMSAEAMGQRTTELLGDGALVVEVAPPSHAMRGRLAELIDEVVERGLARVGAGCPYIAEWTNMPEDAEARFNDQLFRVRSTGATGLVVALGSIAAIARPALTPQDSATLQRLALATREASFVLLIDDGDVRALAYAPPIPLDTLLETRSAHDMTTNDTVVAEIAPLMTPTTSYGEARRRLGEPAPPIEEPAIDTEKEEDASGARLRAAVADEAAEETAAEEAEAIARPLAAPASETPKPIATQIALPIGEQTVTASPGAEETPTIAKAKPAQRERLSRERTSRATVGIPVSGPNDAWRTWAIALSSARGPQTLATFERLFAESYVPLANAIADGLDDARAHRAYDEFRRAFERTYTEAFATFGVTNRRPKLVMDAYDVASKQSRLHNARSAHVLVVDSMRYDIGCSVRDALAKSAAGIASLTMETTLWSALPTTTLRQLETFARGMDALRAPSPIEPAESLRGRSAEVVRRLRVGSRELYKLDLIPAMLEARAENEAIAEGVASSILYHLKTLAPRTLLFILGDHGFTVDRRGELLHGGASPEEVLVPAYAWLIGDLH